jgi:hypothetical protein
MEKPALAPLPLLALQALLLRARASKLSMRTTAAAGAAAAPPCAAASAAP